MGNQQGKYFEDTFRVETAKFDIGMLMQTTDGMYRKCVQPGFEEGLAAAKDGEPVELTSDERRCAKEYLATRKEFNKAARALFEKRVCKQLLIAAHTLHKGFSHTPVHPPNRSRSSWRTRRRRRRRR